MKKIWGRKGNVKGERIIKEETRIPLAVINIMDCSGSMSLDTRVVNEDGSEARVPKIKQMQDGFRKAIESMIRFEKENTRFRLIHQLITLDSYGRAMFDGYKPVNDSQYNLKEVEFTADGVTNVAASFNTLVKYLTTKALGHYNRAVNVIMMSDGVPTDVNGYPLSETAWKKVVDKLKDYLEKNDLDRYVTFYFIAIGDEAEAFGRYLAGDEHFFKVDDCENIAEKFDFVTRLTLANSTTVTGDAIGYGQSFDEDDEEEPSVYDEDEDDSDEDEYDEDEYDEDDASDDEDEPDVDEDEDVDEDDSRDSDEEDEDDDDGDDGDDDGSLDKILDF